MNNSYMYNVLCNILYRQSFFTNQDVIIYNFAVKYLPSFIHTRRPIITKH